MVSASRFCNGDRADESDPRGRFCTREPEFGDYVIHLGPGGAPTVAHGVSWHAYVGPEPSPLSSPAGPNPSGPAMAAVLAATRLFVHDFAPQPG